MLVGKRRVEGKERKKNRKYLAGIRWASINVHHIKHLVTLTRKLGPLWAVSCFAFESMNHLLRKLIHGTGHVLSQVVICLLFSSVLIPNNCEMIWFQVSSFELQLMFSTFFLRNSTKIAATYIQNDIVKNFFSNLTGNDARSQYKRPGWFLFYFVHKRRQT